jgi:hypothetical protein
MRALDTNDTGAEQAVPRKELSRVGVESDHSRPHKKEDLGD